MNDVMSEMIMGRSAMRKVAMGSSGWEFEAQPKSSTELVFSVLLKRVLQRYLVISDLKRVGLVISLSSKERLFQSKWVR